MKAPSAKKRRKELFMHGQTRVDNYYWLNNRKNSEVIKYLKRENKYTDFVLKDEKQLKKRLFQEIVGRIKQDDQSVPYKFNGYYYYERYEKESEYPIYCRRKNLEEAEEQVLLDEEKMAEDHPYYSICGFEVSLNNKLLSFGVDDVSRGLYTIYFKNLETGKLYDESIVDTAGEAVWANDNKTIFYTKKDVDSLRDNRIYKHLLGTDPATDVLIYEEKDEAFEVGIFKSKSQKYIIIESYSTLATEVRIIDADQPEDGISLFQEREEKHEYKVYHDRDEFYILTNWNAVNFRLMKTKNTATAKENWVEIVAHCDTVLIEYLDVFKNHLVVSERFDGLNRMRVISRKDNSEYFIEMDEQTYLSYTLDNNEIDTNKLRFEYSSLTTPDILYDYNMDTKEKEILKQREIVDSKFNSENYQAERFFVEGQGGVKIPISLVYKKGFQKNGKAPLLLYSYGSYGSSIDADFSSARLSLLNRGFVYAIAHVRGGEEMGRFWYEDGKLLKKKNTFTDFIDCGKYLIDNNYTSTEKLFAMGGSAGGLLMGAVLNMAPNLFKGVIAQVPFVDVVTTMLDDSIPLTTGEYDEWGNPNDKTYYDYILSYSPYDNVEKKDYPALLVTTGLHDSQVQYWEPAKWVAKLRELKTDNNILLLKTNMDAGHDGVSGRFESYRETALEYVFLLKIAGIKK